MALLVVLVAIALLAVLLARARSERAARRAAAATVRLEADDWGLRRWLADGRYEEVGWEEMQEVRVLTLPKGPWDSRIRLVFDGGGERGVIVPFDVAEDNDVLPSLSHLPGFDHRRLAEILDEERTGQEILWSRTTT